MMTPHEIIISSLNVTPASSPPRTIADNIIARLAALGYVITLKNHPGGVDHLHDVKNKNGTAKVTGIELHLFPHEDESGYSYKIGIDADGNLVIGAHSHEVTISAGDVPEVLEAISRVKAALREILR